MANVPEAYRSLGSYVRQVRRGLGVPQQYVAERTGVTASYVCQVEKGRTKASDSFLLKLEGALELRPSTLLLKVGKPPLDLMGTLLQPEQESEELLATATEWEREKLTEYLKFLRVQAQLQDLMS